MFYEHPKTIGFSYCSVLMCPEGRILEYFPCDTLNTENINLNAGLLRSPRNSPKHGRVYLKWQLEDLNSWDNIKDKPQVIFKRVILFKNQIF